MLFSEDIVSCEECGEVIEDGDEFMLDLDDDSALCADCLDDLVETLDP